MVFRAKAILKVISHTIPTLEDAQFPPARPSAPGRSLSIVLDGARAPAGWAAASPIAVTRRRPLEHRSGLQSPRPLCTG